MTNNIELSLKVTNKHLRIAPLEILILKEQRGSVLPDHYLKQQRDSRSSALDFIDLKYTNLMICRASLTAHN